MSDSLVHARPGGFLDGTHHGREYKLFVPTTLSPEDRAPLVVMLHGCTQDPDRLAAGTRMNLLAEREGFRVLYPTQATRHHVLGCWNWYDPANHVRGAGEPGAIAALIAHLAEQHATDPGAIFVAGLSAGGAMATILAATYPDVFAALGVVAGLPYGCATTEADALAAMARGGPDPERLGELAHRAAGEAARPVPAIIFHGSADQRVASINARQLVTQWARTYDLAAGGRGLDTRPAETRPGQVPGGRTFVRQTYRDAVGRTAIELYMIDGMGHAWPGGDQRGTHTDPDGPLATRIMWSFFERQRRA